MVWSAEGEIRFGVAGLALRERGRVVRGEIAEEEGIVRTLGSTVPDVVCV